ncbi:hypothetical protein [Streptomyces megasporus]|uniref:hypothetical protein n=1 Tax=Streptomyces megasporus TaxID=44060 RepID=UPI0012FEB870|nr:hypothetical protein [Streptomyces megasporus]
MQDEEEKETLLGRLGALIAAEAHYRAAGDAGDLHTLSTSTAVRNRNKDDPDRGALVRLYDQGMVGRKAGRAFYDRLKAAALDGECPLCGIGEVDTLDHHLPKAVFPLLAIVPLNLIPACMPCNHGKGLRLPTGSEAQPLHPYFDRLGCERWLVAEILPTAPATASFRIEACADWSATLTARVRHHFDTHNLAERYAQQAARYLSGKRSAHRRLLRVGPDVLRAEIRAEAESWAQVDANAWETALLFGLADSDWYVNGGLQEV